MDKEKAHLLKNKIDNFFKESILLKLENKFSKDRDLERIKDQYYIASNACKKNILIAG